MENFITVKDASVILGVTPDTVRERIYRKEITARKMSRGGRNIWMIDGSLLQPTRSRRNTDADFDALLSELLNERGSHSNGSSSRDESDLFEILEMLLKSKLVKEIRAKTDRVLELVALVLARLSELITAGMELIPIRPDSGPAKS